MPIEGETQIEATAAKGTIILRVSIRAVGRSENPGVPVVIRWAKSAPLVEIGLTDLPKSGYPAHPGTTGLSIKHKNQNFN